MRIVYDDGLYVSSKYAAGAYWEYLTDSWSQKETVLRAGSRRRLFVRGCGVVI